MRYCPECGQRSDSLLLCILWVLPFSPGWTEALLRMIG